MKILSEVLQNLSSLTSERIYLEHLCLFQTNIRDDDTDSVGGCA